MPTETDNAISFFAVATTAPRIDHEKGELYDVSLMTVGEALGHDKFIDRTTLELTRAACNGDKLKAFINHSLAPKITETCGYFYGLYISEDGTQLKAERFAFLDSFKKHHAADVESLLELAEKHPGDWGVSVSFDPSTKQLNGRRYSRPQWILSADFVDDPAANPRGLFSRQSAETKTQKNARMKEHIATLQKRFEGKPEQFAKACARFMADPENLDPEAVASEVESEDLAAQLAALQAENQDLKDQLAAYEDTKPEDIEQMSKQVTDLEGKVTQLTSERDNATKALAALNTDAATAHNTETPKPEDGKDVSQLSTREKAVAHAATLVRK